MKAKIVYVAMVLALVFSLTAVAIVPAGPALAQGTPVSGTWTMTGGTGSGTHDGTGNITSGSFTCTFAYAGDISGTFGTFTLTWNPANGNFEGVTGATAATITVGGNTYNASYFAFGHATNVAVSGLPGCWLTPPCPITFTPVGGFFGGTLPGELQDYWIAGVLTGGTGTGSITFTTPTTWSITTAQVPDGTWSGYLFGLAGPPVIVAVPPSSTGTTTLLVGGTQVASVQHPTSTIAGVIGVAKYAQNPGGTPPKLSLGAYVEFATNIPTASWSAPVEIRIYYTDDQVAAAGIDESTLQMYTWDGSNWVVHADTGVNTVQNYVWARVTHFSPNAPMGDPEEGEGCFIATAAYGTSTAAEIDVLKAFRDEVLLESTLGSQLVEWYYQTSPPVADFISENDVLRTLVRELLVNPVVWVVDAVWAVDAILVVDVNWVMDAIGTLWRD